MNKKESHSKATRIVYHAIDIAQRINCPSYLTLDAYFAVGPVFLTAAGVWSLAAKAPWIHIICQAKKSAVAYIDPELSPPGKKGKKRRYGRKLKLTSLLLIIFSFTENRF